VEVNSFLTLIEVIVCCGSYLLTNVIFRIHSKGHSLGEKKPLFNIYVTRFYAGLFAIIYVSYYDNKTVRNMAGTLQIIPRRCK
jgi:hypothetical protein